MLEKIKNLISEVTDNEILASFLFQYVIAKTEEERVSVNQAVTAYCNGLLPKEKVIFQGALQQNLIAILNKLNKISISLGREAIAA
jgi:hypothetical protein